MMNGLSYYNCQDGTNNVIGTILAKLLLNSIGYIRSLKFLDYFCISRCGFKLYYTATEL